MDELTGGRGVVFATGTPVSNSMTELYTIQRYLQHDRLQEMGMGHFDCWASRFGETTTALELAPEGTGYENFRMMEITGGDRDLTATEEALLAEERDALTALCEKEVAKCSS